MGFPDANFEVSRALESVPSNPFPKSFIDLLIVVSYNNFSGQTKLFVNEDDNMKVGKLKVADVDYKNGKACVWSFWSIGALSGEGQRLLKLHPEYAVLKDDWANKTNDDFYASVVYAYMVDYILEERKKQDTDRIELSGNKENIAAMLGVPRPSFSRELINLRDMGLIDFDRKTIKILDIDSLEEILLD